MDFKIEHEGVDLKVIEQPIAQTETNDSEADVTDGGKQGKQDTEGVQSKGDVEPIVNMEDMKLGKEGEKHANATTEMLAELVTDVDKQGKQDTEEVQGKGVVEPIVNNVEGIKLGKEGEKHANATTEMLAELVTDGDKQGKQDSEEVQVKGVVEPIVNNMEDIKLGKEGEKHANTTTELLPELVRNLVLEHTKRLADHEERIKVLEAERNELKQKLENIETKQPTPQQVAMQPGPMSSPPVFINDGKGKGKGTLAQSRIGKSWKSLLPPSFSFVEELKAPEFVVKAETRMSYMHLGRLVPVAPVIDLQAQAPQDFQPGQQVSIQGPHGTIDVQPPASTKGGDFFQCHLAPPPELKVTVPPGFTGSSLMFQRADGSHISVPVPSGKCPGDAFYVAPPALMVWVPQGAQAGQLVSFSVRGANGDNSKVEWFMARIPEKLYSGYFVACLPKPCWSERSLVEEFNEWVARSVWPSVRLMI